MRYELLFKIASGGMGAVYLGRLRGAMGFEQLVAIKRPHAHLLESPDTKRSLMAEARVASRIRHANVVTVRDVEAIDDSVFLVMDYVEGASLLELLAKPLERDERIRVGLRVILDVCAGLQAVHDAANDDGQPLGLVHRDISPHNILVGLDGVARLADFGIAKSLYGNEQSTKNGTVKGKLAYMAPECFVGMVDQRGDIFALGVVIWELLAGRHLFVGTNEGETMHRVLTEIVPSISAVSPHLGTAFDDVVSRALDRNVESRFARADDLMAALETSVRTSELHATHQDVARFVRSQVEESLALRRERVNASLRRGSSTSSEVPAVADATVSLTVATPRRARPFTIAAGGLLAVVLSAAGAAMVRSRSASHVETVSTLPPPKASEPEPPASVAAEQSAAPLPEPSPSRSLATSASVSGAPKPRPSKMAPKRDRSFRNPY